MQLLGRNIFIDTRYFLGKSLDFQSKEFTSLRNAVEKGFANVFITDITELEILKKIDNEVAVAYSKLTSSDIRYLKSIPLFTHFLVTYPAEKARAYFIDQYYNFKKRCKVSVINSDSVNVRDIFNAYSKQQPPFTSDSVKNRKGEFPDAFALSAILNWANQNQKKAYLLSGDSDWKLFADRTYIYPFGENEDRWLNTITSLSEFLDLIIRNESNLENLTVFADSLIEDNCENIQKQATGIIGNCKFEDNSVDLETEIEDSYIFSCTLKQKEIIFVSRESAIYNLEFDVDVVLKYYTVSYENAVYDSEDGVYRNVKEVHFYKRFLISEPLAIEFSYEDGIPANFKILSLEAANTIYVDFEDGDPFTLTDWVLTLPVLVCGVSNGKITENGSGYERFENISKARGIYPQLNINKSSALFTAAMGN